MKYLKLFVTLVVITSMVTSFAFASKTKSGDTKVITAGTKLTQVLNDDELATNKPRTSRMVKTYDRGVMASSSPTPRLETTSSAPLAGTYTIPGDFSNIGNAVAVLNFVGVSDDVVFELGSTSYTELAGVTFGNYDGNDDYSVTVKPATGVAATVNFLPSASEGKGFAFNGAQNVTIDGVNSGGSSLTLQYSGGTFPASDAFAATIYVAGGSSNVTVKNSNIMGQIQTAGTFFDQTDGRPAVFVFWDATGSPNSDITIDNNTITNATFGIKALSYPLDIQGPINYTNNKVGDAFGNPVMHGAIIHGVFGMNYSYNTIDGIEFVPQYWNNGPTEFDIINFTFGPDASFLYDFGQHSGGHIYQFDPTCVVRDNYIQNVVQNYNDAGFPFIVYDLLVRVSNGAFNIYNNKFGNVSTMDDDGTIVGLRAETNTIHNSFRFTGTQEATQLSYPMRSAGGTLYNNAISNEQTGAAGSLVRCLQGTPSGTADGNAYYSANGFITSAAPTAYFATGKDANSQYGPIGFDANMDLVTFPSSAEDIGRPKILLANDVDGEARDTTTAGVRDAGADEVAVNSGMPTAADVLPTVINPPNSAGEPFGLPVTPKVSVKNNSTTATGSFNVTLSGSDGYSSTKSVSLNGLQTSSVTFDPWNPAAPGTYSVTATTMLGGDGTPGNDALTRNQTFANPAAIVGDTVVFNSTTAEGWAGAGSFSFSNSFTKLSGPYSGYSFVTNPSGAITDATAHTVTSPFYNISGIGGDGNVYISFYQSLNTEPSWDRSWFQYSTDGVTWNNLGVLDDPNGVNWYSTALYANAAGSNADPDCWDGVTALGLGLVPDVNTIPPGWTYNGDCATASAPFTGGPDGWVYTQLKITAANYPSVVGASIIKFRFVGFTDAGTHGDGWAIDNMRIGGTPVAFPGGTITGELFHDIDGNGTKDGADSSMTNRTVKLNRFGSTLATTTTDGSGVYSFGPTLVNLPATYDIEVVLPGYGFTTPTSAATDGIAPVSNDANSTSTVNFGAFAGSLSGRKFEDVNNNGTDDSEPGLEGWTIQVKSGSCNGTVIGTATTDATGAYSVALPPGTYYIEEVNQLGFKQTTDTCIVVTVSAGTPNVTANFGNFELGIIKYEALNDLDGDGIKDAGDVTALPSGAFVDFVVYKDGDTLAVSVIGSQTANETFSDLDVGTYVFVQTSTPSGWQVTNGTGNDTVVISASGANSTITQLHFKNPKVNGYVFDDTDGDGTWDGGEPALEGWDVVISGTGGGTVTTDENGFYETWVGGGSHTISVANQTGWSQTTPTANGGTYVFTGTSGTVPGADQLNKNFGKFKNITVSGTVYRDYNGDGVVNGADTPMSATVSLTGQSDQTGSTFSFTGVNGGAKTLSVTVPSGFAATTSASLAISPSSGTNQSGKMFLLLQSADLTTKYRSFTADSLAKLGVKAAARKAGQFPTLGNMFDEMVKQAKDSAKALGIIVGKAGQLRVPTDAKSIKGFVRPKKGADVFSSLITKGKTSNLTHTGTARGLDFFAKNEKRILKENTSLAPGKHDNVFFANLLALSVSVAASDWGKTPEGFGDLKYVGSYEPWQGMTVAEIVDAAGDVMTNWEFVPASTYADMNAAVTAINADFSGAYDTLSFFAGGKMKWTGVKAISASSVLVANPGAAPRVKHDEIWRETPTEISLAQNYPNPFNPTTTIRFELTEPSVVSLKVYNMLGQQVATILDGEEYYSDGMQEVTFDASNLTSGVYFYQIITDVTNEETGATQHFTQTKKMLLTK
jgi:hypothetical protein